MVYTTFIASVQSGGKISVSQATIDPSGNLMPVVSNAGSAPVAVIIGVYVGNTPCSPKSATGPATISGTKVSVGTGGTATLTYSCQSFSGVSGTTVQGVSSAVDRSHVPLHRLGDLARRLSRRRTPTG